MAELTKLRCTLAAKLNTLHLREKERFDRKHPAPTQFRPGDRVIIRLRDTPSFSERSKLDVVYMGLCEVLTRLHKNTYEVQTATQRRQVTVDNMKSFDPFVGKKFPLHYFAPRKQVLPAADDPHVVEKIVEHRGHGSKLAFKVRWRGCDSTEDSWEPVSQFFPSVSEDLKRYTKGKNINLALNTLEVETKLPVVHKRLRLQ
jgi:hypothetical protein